MSGNHRATLLLYAKGKAGRGLARDRRSPAPARDALKVEPAARVRLVRCAGRRLRHLDRLAEMRTVKEIAQIGAAIGREFARASIRIALPNVLAADSEESAGAPILNSSLPRKRCLEARENRLRENRGVRVADGSGRPSNETLTDRPNLGEFGKAGFPELDAINQGQDLAAEYMTIKLSDNERRSLRVRNFGVSRRKTY